MEDAQTLVVAADKDAANGLVKALQQLEPVPQLHTSAKRNLDGETATWLVVASLTSGLLPHVLTFLESVIGGRRVKKIKFGDLEIENPSKEDLRRFREMVDRSIAEKGASQEVSTE
jgi:hypothetical protein